MAARLPHITNPMAATQVARPFHHSGWVYEEKVDGWRVLAYKDAAGVRLVSRQGRDLTRRFPALAAAVKALGAPTLLLDGEIAVFDRQLLSRFEWLRGRPAEETATPPTLIAFDCLYARGKDMRKRPLRVRQNVLEELVDDQQLILPARRLAADGFEAWAEVVERGYEGMVGKDEASPYTEGRALAWLKVKVPHYREGERGWEPKRWREEAGSSERRSVLAQGGNPNWPPWCCSATIAHRHALPRPGSSGPRDPRGSPAGDHPDVLPGASRHRRICRGRSSSGSRGLRPETPRARGLSDSVRRHLWLGRARDGAAADLGPVESVRPGDPPCFVSATRDETAASLDPALVRAGRAGNGRRPALPNGTASGSVTPSMDRRAFLGTLTGGLLAAPVAAEAQRLPRVAHVAFLDGGNIGPQNWQATRDGLRELGYVEGRNVIIDVRSANGQFNQLPDLLAELIRLRIDVIVVAGDPVVAAVKQTTSAVPVVMAAVGDPVGRGFVASLARPGGNITGTSLLTTALTGKWLELAKALNSRIARVAILENGANQTHQLFWAEGLTSAREIALAIFAVDVRSADDFERAFASMAQQMVGAVIVLPDPMLFAQRARLREYVAKYRLPIISSFREEAESGGLISYGPSLRTTFRRAAVYVDKILKGAKPADLPIEQPTSFELVINLKTAKALGLTIPPSLLQRADQVIE